MNVIEVLGYFGSKKKIAEKLQIDISNIWHWEQKGEIPPRRQLQIQKITNGKLKARLEHE